MQPVAAKIYRFEDYTLDLRRGGLRRGECEIGLRPKSFDVLRYLVENAGRLVLKDELINAVWPNVVVTNESLTRCVSDIRSALGDADQRLIKTITRRGYLFASSVTSNSMDMDAEQVDLKTPEKRGFPSGPPRLSIVVLPFANLGGDPEQEYFVDGVTDILTTDLSRISGSFVIACSTAFTYKGKPFDVKQIGHELNVRYVLEGSVQRRGNRMRVNVQLIDTETGNHLWAERFDKPVADLLDMQDEIVARLAGQLDAQLIAVEARRAEQAPQPDSMDLYFRGMAYLSKGFTPEYLAQARSFFERALALDSANVEALVATARVDLVTGNYWMSDDRSTRLARAESTLTKALSLAPEHPLAHRLLAGVQMNTNRAIQGIAECERALTLDRNMAGAHAQIGGAKLYLGRAEETESHINEALRLSPRDNFAHTWMHRAGLAKLLTGAYEDAVARFQRSVEMNRNFPMAHFLLGAALAHLGRLEEARSAVQEGLALNPTFTVRRYRAISPSDNPTYLAQRERVHDGMRKAGVPEG